jgi:rod shape-determining protein MreD
MFYPFYSNNYIYLFSSFLLGLGIDAFLGTWGINAFATCLIAYFRTQLFQSSISMKLIAFHFSPFSGHNFVFYIYQYFYPSAIGTIS